MIDSQGYELKLALDFLNGNGSIYEGEAELKDPDQVVISTITVAEDTLHEIL